MNPVLILIVVVGILSSIANKKRKEEAKRKADQPPASVSTQKKPGSPKSATTSREVRPSPSAASQRSSASGRGVDSKWPWPTAEEKAKSKAKPAQSPNYGGTPRFTHVVTSTLEGGHTHTESSMTGEEPCPPPKPNDLRQHPEAEKSPAANANTLLNFQPNSVLQGVLYAEILGKPKSLQRD